MNPTKQIRKLYGIADEPSIAMLTTTLVNDTPARPRLSKGAMKRTQRLSIEIQHREVTISEVGPVLSVPNTEPVPAESVTACPVCGGRWITIVARVVGDASASTERICHALQQSGLHLQVSPAGQLQICQRSFEEIGFEENKETL